MRVLIPFSKYGHIGDRWRFDPDIPEDAYYPRCDCGCYLRLTPEETFTSPITGRPVAKRICSRCNKSKYDDYYGEDHC